MRAFAKPSCGGGTADSFRPPAPFLPQPRQDIKFLHTPKLQKSCPQVLCNTAQYSNKLSKEHRNHTCLPLPKTSPEMAWVQQKKAPKPKRKDPAETVESTRSLLLFLSGRPPPKSLTQAIHKPPPMNTINPPKSPKKHREPSYDDERSSRHYQEIVVLEDHEPEPDAHAFSFSRDRLIPIAPKHSPAPRVTRERINPPPKIPAPRTMTQYSRDPLPPPPPKPTMTQYSRDPIPPPPPKPTMTQYSRDPLPPPPPKPRMKPRIAVNDGPKLPRHYVAPEASSRIVSPIWASATTPLQM